MPICTPPRPAADRERQSPRMPFSPPTNANTRLWARTSGTISCLRPCALVTKTSSYDVFNRAHRYTNELIPGSTFTSQESSSGSSFFVPLKKPTSPDITTAKRRYSACANIKSAMSLGAMALCIRCSGEATASSIRFAPIRQSACLMDRRASLVIVLRLPGPMPIISTWGLWAQPNRVHSSSMALE